jgi:hypothetical protein
MQPDLPQTEAAIVEMTNAFRKSSALQQVKPNPALTAAARAFAAYLARAGKFSHEADGRTPEKRAEAHGYRYCLVAENLALNLDSRGFEARRLAQEVVEGWKSSPGHRANLLLADATEIGVAVAPMPDKHPKFVSVQMFGRPASLKVTFSIQNLTGRTVHYKLGEAGDTINPRETITHTQCEAGQLSIDGAASIARPVNPRDGDRLVIRPADGRALRVDVERK